MYKAVVFDVDGTMVDTEDAVVEAKLKILAGQGRTMDPAEMLRKIWGKPRYKSFELLGIDDTPENHAKMTGYWLEFSYLTKFTMESRIQSGNCMPRERNWELSPRASAKSSATTSFRPA